MIERIWCRFEPGQWYAGSVMALVVLWGCQSNSPLELPDRVNRPGEAYWKAAGFIGRSRPALDDSVVYVADMEGILRAHRRADGVEIWRRLTVESIARPIRDVVVSGAVVATASGEIRGFDRATGRPLWIFSHPTQPGTLSLASDDSTIYAGAYDYASSAEVFAIASPTGASRWTTNIIPVVDAGPNDRFRVHEPILHDGVVIAGVVWRREGTSPSRGGLAALDAETGEVLWARLLPQPDQAKSTYPSRPAVGANLVVVATEDGNVHTLDKLTGESRWVVTPFDSSDAPLGRLEVILEEDVIIAGSSTGVVVAYSPADGRRLWQTNSMAGAILPPMVAGASTVILGHLQSWITALDIETGRPRWRIWPSDFNGFFGTRMSGDTLYAAGMPGLWAIRVR